MSNARVAIENLKLQYSTIDNAAESFSEPEMTSGMDEDLSSGINLNPADLEEDPFF